MKTLVSAWLTCAAFAFVVSAGGCWAMAMGCAAAADRLQP